MSLSPALKTSPALSEETVESSVAASLGLNAQLFVFQLINFAIVSLIIWFLILRPLSRKLEERRKLINESLDKAKEVETNLQMSERKYQERIDEAKVESSHMLELAAAEADKLSTNLKIKAKKDIGLLIDQAKRNMAIERDEMVASVRKEMAELISNATEKILKEKLDEKKDAKLIEATIEDTKTNLKV